MSRKPPPFFTFSISRQTYITYSTLDYHNSITQKISHDDYQLSTKPIRQKRLEIKKMMVSEDITHDDDQLSTKTIQDHEDDGIMEKESLFEDITHDDDQLSTKTTQDHEDDGIMEREEDFDEKREFIRRHRVLYYIFNRWCVIINVSFGI